MGRIYLLNLISLLFSFCFFKVFFVAFKIDLLLFFVIIYTSLIFVFKLLQFEIKREHFRDWQIIQSKSVKRRDK
jgi:hypothetical protein